MQNAITVKEIKQVPTAKLIPNDRNRGINPSLKSNLQKSMTLFGFRPEMPIWVDKDLNIVDGHNRYAAAIQLGIPKVPVIVIDHELAFHQIVKLTGTRRSWGALDWCNYYKNDNPAYAMLGHYAEEFKITVRNAAVIIGLNGSSRNAIPSGEFTKAPDKLFDKKVTTYRALLNIPNAPVTMLRQSSFVEAYAGVICYADKAKFLTQMEKAIKNNQLTPQTGNKNYVGLLNRIYNSGVNMSVYHDLVQLTKKAKGAKK